ncbi:hypothetical protein ACHAXR_012616 [Thalassiosira sp. AJA248-18]
MVRLVFRPYTQI